MRVGQSRELHVADITCGRHLKTVLSLTPEKGLIF